MWELYKDVWTLWEANPLSSDKPHAFMVLAILSGFAGLITSIISVCTSDSAVPFEAGIIAVVLVTAASVALWPLVALAAACGVAYVVGRGVWYWVVRIRPLLSKKEPTIPRAVALTDVDDDDE